MCRIDAPFSGAPLDENPNSSTRFLQALDEYGAGGDFRALLTQHFSESWCRVFGGVSGLEEALGSTQKLASCRDKFKALLSAAPLASRLGFEFDRYAIDQQRGTLQGNYFLIEFVRDVAENLFPKSAYGLYKSGLDLALSISYVKFVSVFYGKEFLFSSSFFGDEALVSLDLSERQKILWRVFEQMLGQTASSENLTAVACQRFVPGPLARTAHTFQCAIGFLKAWVKSDAQFGRAGKVLLEKFISPWFFWLESDIDEATPSHQLPERAVEEVKHWLFETRQEISTLYYCHSDLSRASAQEIVHWASGLDDLFRCNTDDYPGISSLTHEELLARESVYLDELCARLNAMQVNAWIQWTINQDSEDLLQSRAKSGMSIWSCSKTWWATDYSKTCKETLEKALEGLDAEARLSVLSVELPFPSEESHQAYSGWWNGLLRDLRENTDFPKQLLPQWTLAALSRLSKEEMLPRVDESIGILRGELSGGGASDLHKQLGCLLSALDHWDPNKAFRHRLMLMRVLPTPLTDESLSRFNSMRNEDEAIVWDRPMTELAMIRLNTLEYRTQGITREEWGQVELELLTAFVGELAKFCLSRLSLRKGQKVTSGDSYDASQVVEPSPIMRQGYLKVLTELGVDLGGKVHKTVYFIRQSDPDEDVRAIAAECYKSVRRDKKKQSSVKDLRRGIIAAEWWFLLCQRRELGLDVNYEEAVKTRRRLLRHL